MIEGEQVTIYALVDTAGLVHYVGQTRHLEVRRRQHRVVRPELTMIVVTTTDEAHADEIERHWIEYYRGLGRPLLNAKGYRPGGRGSKRDRVAASDRSAVGFYLGRDERRRIEGIARCENRSVHGQIRQFIQESLAARAAAVPTPEPEEEGAP